MYIFIFMPLVKNKQTNKQLLPHIQSKFSLFSLKPFPHVPQ